MHISVDFITKLSLAQEYDSILVVVNRLTKIVYFIPTTCYDLAKQLSYYLYFFSFSFLLFLLSMDAWDKSDS